TNILIKGVGKNGFRAPESELDCQNSGTTMRLLAGVLAGQNFTSVLTGDESLKKRPMRRVIKPLEKMGARIDSNDGCAPLTIYGQNPLHPVVFELLVPSAQVKSCVLLAGLNAAGKTKVRNSKNQIAVSALRDHTERMLKWFGVEISDEVIEENDSFTFQTLVSGDSKLVARDFQIPGDVSAAAFFLVGAACLLDSDLLLKDVGLNATRSEIITVLEMFGAQIQIENKREVCNEPVGDVRVRGAKLLRNDQGMMIWNGANVARTIDELPILAVFGTQLEHGMQINDAGELRVKESDRISAIVENLRRMGATVEEFEDGLRVEKSKLTGAKIDSFGDHRIAMAFAVAGLLAEGETEIENADSVAVSFPDFFDLLESITER
ncbi:MAG TPA: 3-phosphoshikimate 1-carboxyvinyltransferase, partial [Pyrinomonadaceae bacterium]|nr:3-phosphoshikimate 1-carboxyvinyltransferase [Pyrinomonadaceae bacterium]